MTKVSCCHIYSLGFIYIGTGHLIWVLTIRIRIPIQQDILYIKANLCSFGSFTHVCFIHHMQGNNLFLCVSKTKLALYYKNYLQRCCNCSQHSNYVHTGWPPGVSCPPPNSFLLHSDLLHPCRLLQHQWEM